MQGPHLWLPPQVRATRALCSTRKPSKTRARLPHPGPAKLTPCQAHLMQQRPLPTGAHAHHLCCSRTQPPSNDIVRRRPAGHAPPPPAPSSPGSGRSPPHSSCLTRRPAPPRRLRRWRCRLHGRGGEAGAGEVVSEISSIKMRAMWGCALAARCACIHPCVHHMRHRGACGIAREGATAEGGWRRPSSEVGSRALILDSVNRDPPLPPPSHPTHRVGDTVGHRGGVVQHQQHQWHGWTGVGGAEGVPGGGGRECARACMVSACPAPSLHALPRCLARLGGPVQQHHGQAPSAAQHWGRRQLAELGAGIALAQAAAVHTLRGRCRSQEHACRQQQHVA